MAIHEPGRAYDYAPERTQTHYIVSEQVEYQLRLLAEAMRSAGTLCEELGDHLTDFGPAEAAPLFQVFAERAADLLATAQPRFPAAEEVP